jgi:FkbM family methyltransferase
MNTWIYGNGGYGQRLFQEFQLNKLDFSGFITLREELVKNDFSSARKVVKPGDIVYLGVFNHLTDLDNIIRDLNDLGAARVITPGEYMLNNPFSNMETYFLSPDPNKYASENQIKEIVTMLADQESESVLQGLWNYQKTGIYKKIIRSDRHEVQYLATTLPEGAFKAWHAGKLMWIDFGSFDGDTVKSLFRYRESTEDSFICIEPDEINFRNLKFSLAELPVRSIALNVASGNSDTFIQFDSGNGLSSKLDSKEINLQYSNPIATIKLDSLLHNWGITHIKMDIEGSEMLTLLGSVKTLVDQRPRIAVAIYHKPLDLYEIPKFLMNTLNEYSWFVRSYGAHGYDTIIYGIPREIYP